MSVRKIIHLDLDAFFCAVEELSNPQLRGKAFAVGGRPDGRGVVSSCSYPARRFGVHSAMPMARALRLCPELIVISTHFSDYHAASQQVMAILNRVSALVEQVSIDEAYVDVSDLPQSGEEIGRSLQRAVNQELRLPCSLGIASNKLMAKIANNIGKESHRGDSPPNAITVVHAGEEAAFLAPLPVKNLFGVGPKTAARLEEMGFFTIGQMADATSSTLTAAFGKYGFDLARHARGIDDSPVVVEHEVKSISQETTFDKDTSDRKKLIDTLQSLSAQVAYRLRNEGVCALTVRIKLRWPDFRTHTRQITLTQPTDQDGIILAAAIKLFDGLWENGRAVRLIGVGAAQLSEPVQQMSLWDTPTEKEHRLLTAMDELRQRYGKNAIRLGKQIQPGNKKP
jgi:DNA polymerase IV